MFRVMKFVSAVLCVSAIGIGAASAQTALCVEYCELTLRACQGETEVYADEPSCLQACADFPDDAPDDAVSGNSVQCRIEHANLALGEEGPVKHCPHTTAAGGGVCTDRTPCEGYCLFYLDRVSDNECPQIPEWGDDLGSVEQGTGEFVVSEPCLQACTAFAGAGDSGETSGNSANCRLYYYLMAHREPDADKRAVLCQNAHPYESPMCVGERFEDLYTRTVPDACAEQCFHDDFSCGSTHGTQAECLATCAGADTGERGAMVGDSTHCRVTYLANATLTADPMQKSLLCLLGSPASLACKAGGRAGTLTPIGHGPQRAPDEMDEPMDDDDGGCRAAPGMPSAGWGMLALLGLVVRRRAR